MLLTPSLREHHGGHSSTFKQWKTIQEVGQGTCVAKGTWDSFGEASRSLVQQTRRLCITSLLSDGCVQGRSKYLLQALVPKA